MSSHKSKPGHIKYDAGVHRFRDARGRFVSYKRGVASKYGRSSYKRSLGVSVLPKKPAKAKRKKIIKRKRLKLPTYYTSSVVVRGKRIPNQVLVYGIGRLGVASLARLILHQIKLGYIRFRFWYRLVDIGYGSEGQKANNSLLGSTKPLLSNVVTFNKRLSEVESFLDGRGEFINGKVIYYWMSKRLR